MGGDIERERKRDRQTDRLIDRQTDRQRLKVQRGCEGGGMERERRGGGVGGAVRGDSYARKDTGRERMKQRLRET